MRIVTNQGILFNIDVLIEHVYFVSVPIFCLISVQFFNLIDWNGKYLISSAVHKGNTGVIYKDGLNKIKLWKINSVYLTSGVFRAKSLTML